MIETKHHSRVLQIALCNPANGNIIDIQLCSALLEAFEQAEVDNSVGAILLTANAQKIVSIIRPAQPVVWCS